MAAPLTTYLELTTEELQLQRLTGVGLPGATNEREQWAVRDDYFWCRMIYKKGEQRERGFLTGYSKAVQLKAAMETYVNIHLKVRRLPLSSVAHA